MNLYTPKDFPVSIDMRLPVYKQQSPTEQLNFELTNGYGFQYYSTNKTCQNVSQIFKS